jgi:hypothetical protein
MSDFELPRDPAAAAKLLRQIASTPPDPTHGDLTPWDFLERLPDALKEQLARPVLHELLLDPAPAVRKLALGKLTNFPDSASTAAVLVDAARQRSALYPGEIGQSLQHALSVRAPTREGAAAIASLARSGPLEMSAAAIVGQYDADAGIALARRHVAAGVDARTWTNLAGAFAMYQRDRLLELLQVMASLPPDAKVRVLGECESALDVSEAHVQAWAQQSGNPPPARPKPSPDECRRVLGL